MLYGAKPWFVSLRNMNFPFPMDFYIKYLLRIILSIQGGGRGDTTHGKSALKPPQAVHKPIWHIKPKLNNETGHTYLAPILAGRDLPIRKQLFLLTF